MDCTQIKILLSIVVHVNNKNASRILAGVYRRHHGIIRPIASPVAKSTARVATQIIAESLPMIQHCVLKLEHKLSKHVLSIYTHLQSPAHMLEELIC